MICRNPAVFSQPATGRGTLICVTQTKQEPAGWTGRWPVPSRAAACAILGAAAQVASGQQTASATSGDLLARFEAPTHFSAAAAERTSLPDAPSALRHPLQLSTSGLIQHEQPGAIPLTIDQAIATALKGNTSIIISGQQQQFVRGEIYTVGNSLLPNLQVTGYARAQEINLVAMGFKANSIHIPGFNSVIPEIVKVNTVSGQVSLSQNLSLPALYLFRAAGRASEAAKWSTLNVRGGAVLQAGGLYLQILADAAQVRNAQALLKQDQLVFDQAKAQRDAGVGINLDVLRAQVDLQNEQQQLVRAANAEAKDKIQLNRAMGQPAGQQLELTEAAPFAEFDADSSDAALQADLKIAYERRKDLRGLQAQLSVAQETAKALKYERLPVLGVGGYFGLLGQIGGSYYGVYTAEGRISVPIFLEAELRGQREVNAAQVRALEQQVSANRSQIEADIRSSLLDVQTARELVTVARSNVVLATQALEDATARFTSGVDDNLAVVRAQASLESAENQTVQAEFQYNFAKLQLARNIGVVETEYKRYLGK